LAIEVRAVPAEQTRPLRQVVLRPGQPPESTVYPGDDDSGTVHLAALEDGELLGVASLYREPRPGADARAPAWRLRGMATAPHARGRRVGRALLAACRTHVAGEGGGELWCNARTSAARFYAAAGFEVVSDEFDVPDIGRHVVMRTDVLPASRHPSRDT
jgi:GNAT superfamily N-acetyltransferase